MLEVKNISKTFGKTTILDNINFSINENSLTCIIGSNGAGKSTLINILARTLKQDNGSVLLNGKDLHLWNSKELAKKIALLSQANNTNVRLTVKELVSFGRYPHSKGKLSEIDKIKINEALDYLNISNLKDKYLDELSGGQRQMAFISMAIAQDTDYILLDEPLNNLDMKHSTRIMKILKTLVLEKKKTVIIVIHDINFVSVYADYIIALKQGKLVKYGKNEELISSKNLKEIYSLDIDIHKIQNHNICTYYF